MQSGHNHDHHAHDHGAGHSHAPKVTEKNRRAVGFAALITGAFMLVEVAGGYISGSLALLADAGHMLTDFGALAMAWFAFRLAQRPADWTRTYGFDRFSILVAFVNGISLFAIAAIIIWEAAQRLMSPVAVMGTEMLVVASLGLVVNLIALWLLSRGEAGNLNIRAASLHVIGDLLGSVAAIGAAAIIILTGWMPADPILSVIVALIILKSAWAITRESAHILLEAAPEGLESDRIAADLTANVAGLLSVDHIHTWSITQNRPMMTLHAVAADDVRGPVICAAIRERLARQFHVEHATIEIGRRASASATATCEYPVVGQPERQPRP